MKIETNVMYIHELHELFCISRRLAFIKKNEEAATKNPLKFAFYNRKQSLYLLKQSFKPASGKYFTVMCVMYMKTLTIIYQTSFRNIYFFFLEYCYNFIFSHHIIHVNTHLILCHRLCLSLSCL